MRYIAKCKIDNVRLWGIFEVIDNRVEIWNFYHSYRTAKQFMDIAWANPMSNYYGKVIMGW